MMMRQWDGVQTILLVVKAAAAGAIPEAIKTMEALEQPILEVRKPMEGGV